LAISPFSLREQVFGIQHVQVNIPERPLHANVIVHQPEDIGADREFRYGEHRRNLARILGKAIEESMPGMTDHAWAYSIGENAAEGVNSDTEVIATSGDPQQEAEVVAEICREGLSFV